MRAVPAPKWIIGLGYCLAAVVLDWLSVIGLYRSLGVTPWSPISGLSLAFCFAYGLSAMPFVVAAEAAVLLFSNSAGFSWLGIVMLIATNSAIWFGAGLMLRNRPEFDARFSGLQPLLSLLAIAIGQAALHCLVYVGALWFSDLIRLDTVYPVSWRLFVGHLVGILVVAPPLIMLYAGWRPPRLTALRVSQFLVLAAAIWVVFSYRTATTYQLFYLLFLPLLWIALKDGIGGAVIMLNLTQIGIVVGTQLRVGPGPTTGSLQVLMIALALTGLLVGAVVTDREEAERRLREQQAALNRALRLRSAGETAAAISHQISQPITAISTYASVARDSLDKNDLDLARTALARLTDECDRAAAVARSIRDLVKQGTLERSQVRLEDIAIKLRSAHSAECEGLGIALDIDMTGALSTIDADGIQLEQALDNLVTNSIEAIRDSGRGSHIRVAVGMDDSDTHFEVQDNGPGFAAGLEAIATTPFMTTKINGTGLGLAIARSVAEAHGGSLAVVNRGTGACVRLRLPNTGK